MANVSELVIRPASTDDAEGIQAIYAPVVRDTTISFEFEPPTVEEMRRRWEDGHLRYPWLVAVEGRRVLGYSYASTHRARTGYQWSAETSIFVADGARRRGIARALYGLLLETLWAQGFANAFAGIGLPNPGSVALHETFGFRFIGVFERIGFKLGQWVDVGWWQLSAPRVSRSPAPTLPFAEIAESGPFHEAAARAMKRITA